jgi:hypothetical protein
MTATEQHANINSFIVLLHRSLSGALPVFEEAFSNAVMKKTISTTGINVFAMAVKVSMTIHAAVWRFSFMLKVSSTKNLLQKRVCKQRCPLKSSIASGKQ